MDDIQARELNAELKEIAKNLKSIDGRLNNIYMAILGLSTKLK